MQIMQRNETVFQKQIEQLEMKIKGNNLIIHGMDLQNNSIDEVPDLIMNVLQFKSHLIINNVRTMGRTKKILLVELSSYCAVNEIIKNAKLLKATSISIHRDYPVKIRERRAILYHIQKEIKINNSDLKSWMVGDMLHIEELEFY